MKIHKPMFYRIYKVEHKYLCYYLSSLPLGFMEISFFFVCLFMFVFFLRFISPSYPPLIFTANVTYLLKSQKREKEKKDLTTWWNGHWSACPWVARLVTAPFRGVPVPGGITTSLKSPHDITNGTEPDPGPGAMNETPVGGEVITRSTDGTTDGIAPHPQTPVQDQTWAAGIDPRQRTAVAVAVDLPPPV